MEHARHNLSNRSDTVGELLLVHKGDEATLTGPS
jgi:hypothetical protein